uniref:Cysteine protease n=1 Tax=Schistosoma japonicum TaxID=6182 RepID=C7TXZ7_SCHJA|nr:autophagy-related cysteine endopeptidase 2 [Schistosoma japonicum]
MDSQWEAIFNHSNSAPDHPYLPGVSKPVYILGNKYDSIDDREEIAHHLKSRLWMTYRKGFSPIGSRNGPKSDAGWGCMHRCGQMILAEAMLRVHLGRSWRWSPEQESPEYYRLLQMFQDRRSVLYSIQTITLTGLSVGKSIGSWFGPNTIAQVLKKLSVYDRWTNLFVHISVEDGIIIDEIKSLCCQRRPYFNFANNNDYSNKNESQSDPTQERNDVENDAAEESDSSTSSFNCPFAQAVINLNKNGDWNNDAVHLRPYDSELIDLQSQLQLPVTREIDDGCIEIVLPPTFNSSTITTTTTQLNESNVLSSSSLITPSISSHMICEDNKTCRPTDETNDNEHTKENQQLSMNYEASQHDSNQINSTTAASVCESSSLSSTNPPSSNWRPLLLFVPLRLGLHNPNPCYFNAIKAVFRLPNCIGILGGSPCHAVWIVGVTGDDVICLDPHTTQPAGRGNLKPDYDQTYHCENPIRMPLKRLDPSMVLGFLCSTEKEFDDLCHDLKDEVLHPSVASSWPLVEIHATRPANLPPLPSANIPNDLLISVYSPDYDNDDDLVGRDTNENVVSSRNANSIIEDRINDTDNNLDHEGILSEAVGTVKALWSKCNQVAGDTVRSLATVPQRLVKGSEYEVS